MANYEVDPTSLLPYLPSGTELDLFEGKCYVSLVGFMFEETKMLGVKIPFHVNFEEVNLRFYVKRKYKDEWRRGVVFLKEIVRKPAITFVANTLYSENYATHPTYSFKERKEEMFTVSYKWGWGKNKNEIRFVSDNKRYPLIPGSKEEFITEHYWGYAKGRNHTMEYAVEHPCWEIMGCREYTINCYFGKVYGKEFTYLEKEKPSSVFMAGGSDIIVRKGVKFTG
jgi:uncharacterized protein YqjF (DUF2071 family)